MRKLILLFLIFACAFAQAQQAAKPVLEAKPTQAQKPALSWCRLGVDPVDAARKPDLGSECVVKSPAMPVTMLTGSGRHVRCILPPLTPVVVDRGSGAARWVLACGNPILQPANWVPAGTRICGPEPAQQATPAAASAPAVPAAPQAPVAPTQVRVDGEVRVVHEGEVRLVHSGEIRHVHEPETPAPAPTPQPHKGWWSRNAKWVIPVAIGAGTGAAVALTRGGGQKTVTYQPLPPPLYRP